MRLLYKQFKHINLADEFFNSLKTDYSEFSDWFAKKAEEYAYVFERSNGKIDGFLYLKVEDGVVDDVTPPLPAAHRIKVGTFKINAHGTKLGERFVKKIFDHAIYFKADQIYVTAFETHAGLIDIFKRYGFVKEASKITKNGIESVYVKSLKTPSTNVVSSYPLVQLAKKKIYLLAIQPQWHTQLLPDSILTNENADIVQDISHTNSIHKVYLGAMKGMDQIRPGDTILIYRTTDNLGPAHHRSVATSICVAEEYRSIHSFESQEAFLKYCRPYSVFTEEQLTQFWNSKRFPHVIRFTYNIALKKRVTRGVMIEEVGIPAGEYWGFMPLTPKQFLDVVSRGQIDESLIIH